MPTPESSTPSPPNPTSSSTPKSSSPNTEPLYLLATGAGASATLVAAFVEDLIETARRLAARSPRARLDPPLLLALDEIGNLAPLPSLPVLMAEGCGTEITTMPVLQSLAQARNRWSEQQASAIWDASIVKIILGGASNSRDLQDLATPIGERDEYTDSITLGDHGTRSNQRSIRRVPILPPDRIRTLPFGTGITLLRSPPSSPTSAPGLPAPTPNNSAPTATPSKHSYVNARLSTIPPDDDAWEARAHLPGRAATQLTARDQEDATMAIHTQESLSGFIASEPLLTETAKGDARFSARIGKEHFRSEEDGSFTQTETTYHHLVLFGRSAEHAYARFTQGNNFIAEGYTRPVNYERNGPAISGEEFVAKKIGHDAARTPLRGGPDSAQGSRPGSSDVRPDTAGSDRGPHLPGQHVSSGAETP